MPTANLMCCKTSNMPTANVLCLITSTANAWRYKASKHPHSRCIVLYNLNAHSQCPAVAGGALPGVVWLCNDRRTGPDRLTLWRCMCWETPHASISISVYLYVWRVRIFMCGGIPYASIYSLMIFIYVTGARLYVWRNTVCVDIYLYVLGGVL